MTHFPVPDEFYDDPCYDGVSDAAIALWTRSGSFSARHLTDGFVPSTKLAALTTQIDTAPAELVRVGAWRRTRGGFQFVVWPKECTRAYVEAKREAWRRRQANRRNEAPDLPASNHGNKSITRHDRTGRDPGHNNDTATPSEPDTTRSEASMSRRDSPVSHGSSPRVTNGVSHPSPVPVPVPVPSLGLPMGERPVGRRAQDQKPPERCPQHENDDRPPPCGACADHRRAAERFDTDRKATVRACQLCDGDGWRYQPGRRIPMTPYVRCDHTREQALT